MRFILDFPPMPCPRPRVALAKNRKFAHAYYPAAYKNWKTNVAKAVKAQFKDRHVYDFPVAVDVAFSVKRPKSTKLEAPKPDIDNYLKAILDAMTDAGVWDDDKHVVTVRATKRWADADCINVLVSTEYIP
jgi:Holliday junction resolvase RusA-like endonuclease